MRGVPKKLLGGITQWVKDKAMKVLGVSKKFFKLSPLGLGISGIKKGFGALGIGGRDKPTLFDRGGALQPGLSTVYNGTRRPEQILTDKQWKSLIESRGQGGDTINATAYGADPEKVVNDLFRRMERERRRVKRSGAASRKVTV
jgi:hypothetical protein